MSKKVVIIVVRDGFWYGVIGDAVMYGLMLGVWYINYKYLGNSWFIGLTLAFLIITSVANRMTSTFKHTFYSYDDALGYLQEAAPKPEKAGSNGK